jgi:hypothetical protein
MVKYSDCIMYNCINVDSARKKWFLFLTKYYLGDEINKNDIGVACSTWGRGGVLIGLGGENRETWEDNIKMILQQVRAEHVARMGKRRIQGLCAET